jgi:hypothetical protein
MLTISPAVANSVQAHVNEMGEATIDQAAKLESQTSASSPLSSLVPDGGLHSVAHAAADGTANGGMQSLAQQVIGQVGNMLNIGGQIPHPNSNATARDPLGGPMGLMQQIMQISSGG